MPAEAPPPQRPRRAFDGKGGYDLAQHMPAPLTRLLGAVFARVARALAMRGPVARSEVAFDVLFGVVLPPLLLYLDRAWDPAGEGGIVVGLTYAFPMSVGAGLLLLFWRLRGERREWTQAVYAGAFGAAACVSFGVGVLMLPYTLIGVFLLIGFIGFLPFLAAFVFLRGAVRALDRAQPDIDRGPAVGVAVLAALVVLGGTAAQGRFAKGVARYHQQVVIGAREGDADRSERRLHLLYRFPGVPLVTLERAHRAAGETERERLGDAYHRITGRYLYVGS